MDVSPSAPPVVAVVVTCDPGWWLEECLGALANQDYPNLSVLVVDANSGDDPTSRVAAVMPTAYVRRVGVRHGFAAAANEVLVVVEGASHYLFCHDDVAPAPDAVRLLVEEAFRSNAGIVTPKLVRWEAADRLLSVGVSADKGGVLVPFVERGELDQEQHDAVRDVFVAPAGCCLVRADLFATLGGFDLHVGLAGEDLDLSWRAQIAGARVIVAPAAVVAHAEVTATGRRELDGTLAPDAPPAAASTTEPQATGVGATGARRRRRGPAKSRAGPSDGRAEALADARDVARLRTVRIGYGLLHRVRVLPQLAAVTALEILAALGTGYRARAQAAWRPWRVSLRAPGIRAARSRVRALRAVPDHEVRALQASGNASLRALLRGTAQQAADPLRATSVDLASSWRAGLRVSVSVWAVAVVVVVFGSRHVLGSHLPTFGELVPLASPTALARHALSGWRATGMGAPSPAPTAFWLLAGAGAILLGHMALLQRILVLGMVPLGVFGALRLGGAFRSRRGRLATAVLYAANPLPYNALSRGRWSGLIAYAIVPWVLAALARATRLAPFSSSPGDGTGPVDTRMAKGPGDRGLFRAAIGLGVGLAVVASFVPYLLAVTVGLALMLAVGSLLAGGLRASLRALVTAAVATATSLVLLFPWAIGFLPPGGEWAMVTRPADRLGQAGTLGQLLRFQTGPTGASVLGWALLAAAATPLIVGAGWRFAWAVRLWTVALGSWAVAWVGARGWLAVPLPAAEVMLAPAAVALAACAGLGLAAFEIDLRGYRFGWRQFVSTVAATSAVFAVLPVVGGALDGRWRSPSSGFENILSWMPDKVAEGSFRVLWLGDPSVLPIAGWVAGPRLAFATSRDGMGDVTTTWPGTSRGATRVLAQGVSLAEQDRTTQLGHLLAPFSVRYLVAVQRSAPLGQPGTARPSSPDLLDGLQSQIDLRRVDSDPSLVVYENAAWIPARAVLEPASATVSQADNPAAARDVTLSGRPVLASARAPSSYRGPLPGGVVLLSEAPSPRWHLRVGAVSAPRSDAFGVANAFSVTSPGPGTASYATPAVRRLALGLQALLWLGAVAWMWRSRRRRTATNPDEPTPVAGRLRRLPPSAAAIGPAPPGGPLGVG